VVTAWEAGADIVKIFPSDLTGPKYLKALHGPLPQVLLMPTGGVDLTTAADFLRCGACALGIGGSLVEKSAVEKGDFARIESEDARATFETSFMVVVGPRTAFPGSSATRASEIQDDLSQTILVAETPTFGVAWTQPVDLRADQMRFVINGRAGIEIGSRFSDGAHVGMADGGVQFLPNETPAEHVQAMSTIAGRETLPWIDFP
jgi:hypothetical protein